MFYRKRSEFQHIDAAENTQPGPTNRRFHNYENVKITPQIENEARYQTTSAAGRSRTLIYPSERDQAAAAKPKYATIAPRNRDRSTAYENHAIDIATSSDQHVYMKMSEIPL